MKKSMITLKEKVLFFIMMFGISFANAADYANVVQQSKDAVEAGEKIVAPWIELLIAWAPFIGILIAIFGVYAYERNKAKEERKDGTFKIILILVFVALAVVLIIELVISIVMNYMTGDPTMGTQIRQTYWNTLLGLI